MTAINPIIEHPAPTQSLVLGARHFSFSESNPRSPV
jgi:hypothetical protein